MKISTFCLIKNEVDFVGFCIMSVLDQVDEMVFADGNSTDGTLKLIEHIRKEYDKDKKIKLFKNRDCRNLRDAYVNLNNWTIKQCSGDIIWFLHPDQIVYRPEIIRSSLTIDALRYSVRMISFAGDTDHMFEQGRTDTWSTIYKNTFGLKYIGWYGAINEDLYFTGITGDDYTFYKYSDYLPYKIEDTDIVIYHYCDTKPYERRLGRMIKILENLFPGGEKEALLDIAKKHPRVTLRDGYGLEVKLKIKKITLDQPEVFEKYKYFKEFKSLK